MPDDPNSPKETGRRTAFRVKDYPFFTMHWIVTKNGQNIADAVRAFGITPQIWRILVRLHERDGISITELAESSLIDRGLLSRILSDLEERRFVRKRANQKDKRYTGIYLAPKGRKMFVSVLPLARRQIDYAISDLSASDLGTLKRILGAMTRKLSR